MGSGTRLKKGTIMLLIPPPLLVKGLEAVAAAVAAALVKNAVDDAYKAGKQRLREQAAADVAATDRF